LTGTPFIYLFRLNVNATFPLKKFLINADSRWWPVIALLLSIYNYFNRN